MTELATEQTQTVSVQRDENGIEIVTDFPEPQFPGQKGYETWAFLDTRARDHFFARFRRLVNVNGIRYAEIDYAAFMNQQERKVRWCSLTDFKALEKCKSGDNLHCIWMVGKPYVLAITGSERGRDLTQKEWDDLCNGRYIFPEFYNRLVEA
jgi:hypothetical protein